MSERGDNDATGLLRLILGELSALRGDLAAVPVVRPVIMAGDGLDSSRAQAFVSAAGAAAPSPEPRGGPLPIHERPGETTTTWRVLTGDGAIQSMRTTIPGTDVVLAVRRSDSDASVFGVEVALQRGGAAYGLTRQAIVVAADENGTDS